MEKELGDLAGPSNEAGRPASPQPVHASLPLLLEPSRILVAPGVFFSCALVSKAKSLRERGSGQTRWNFQREGLWASFLPTPHLPPWNKS